jgi:3-oxoacyl-[acyl-carrier protein] reductase
VGSGAGALAGRVALITGASRGIGRAIAAALADAGATVAITARSGSALASLEAELAAAGATVLPLVADLRDATRIAPLAEAVARHCGRLDVLVNNAGAGHFGPVGDAGVEVWDELMSVNARAPYLLCRACLPLLRRAEPGFIVNIASVVGLRGYAGQVAYTASKHALVGMSRALVQELRAEPVRVHTLCPGGTATDMLRRARPDIPPEEAIGVREIAELVVFLVTRTGNAVIDEIGLRRAAAP